MRICSFCNGLKTVEKHCPFCGLLLTDGGPITDYYGPYSPYMSKDSLEPAESHGCVHLMYCSQCGFDTREGAPEAEV